MTSSFLFNGILPSLIEGGTKLESLLTSNVFTIECDFDEWPGSHPNDEEIIKPYNKSLF